MTVIVGAVLLIAAVVFFLIHPVMAGRKASLHREEDEPTEAEARRRVTLLALRDVEYDFATGKLGEEDYQALRRELAAEALAALAAVEAEAAAAGGAHSALEQEVLRLRGGLAIGSTCLTCGSANAPDHRFCTYCGTPLRPARPEAPVASAGPASRPEPA